MKVSGILDTMLFLLILPSSTFCCKMFAYLHKDPGLFLNVGAPVYAIQIVFLCVKLKCCSFKSSFLRGGGGKGHKINKKAER
jgi:hypothetical protein